MISISVGSVVNGKIVGDSPKYEQFEALIKDFSAYAGQTILSAEKLARMMAGKARPDHYLWNVCGKVS